MGPEDSVELYKDPSLEFYFKEINNIPLLSREEEIELAAKVRQGDQEALEKLTKSNLRFVISVARKYQNRGLPLSDLICEGNIGLIEAAHRFDETKGFKFISYAVWWIRQAILAALAEQSRIVKLPFNRLGDLYKIDKRKTALTQELGHVPSNEDIAESIGFDTADIQKALDVAQHDLSLDAPISPDGQKSLMDIMASNQPDVDEETLQSDLNRVVGESLAALGEREANILRLYFGLDDGEPKTLTEIGSYLGITKERVRQIKENALNRLRKGQTGLALESLWN